MNQIGPVFLAVVGSVITLAIVAVVVAQQAQTATVIQAGGTALANVIAAAVKPVQGSGFTTFNNGVGSTGSLLGS